MGDQNPGKEEEQDLDAMMAESRIVTGDEMFSLPESSGDEEKGDDETPGEDDGAQDGREAPLEEEQGTQEEEKKEEEKFRFEDHAAAEEGFRSIEERALRAEQELAEAKKTLAQKEADEQAARLAAEKEKASREYAVERQKKTLAAINDLDPEDPDYDDKVARAWADSNLDIFNYAQDPPLESGEASEDPGEPREERTPPEKRDPSQSEIREFVNQCASEAGITRKQMPVFLGFAAQSSEYRPDGTPATIGEQVQWAIDQTTKHYADMRAQVRAEMEQPMTRQGQGRDPGGDKQEKPGIVTLDDALNGAMEQRRI